MKRQHKWLVAAALLITVVAWLAWTLLSAESDIEPQGRTEPPAQQTARV